MKTIEQAAMEYGKKYVKSAFGTDAISEKSFEAGAEFALSNWIPVEDALPDVTENKFYPDCIFVVNNPNGAYHERVFGGIYVGDPSSDYDLDRNRFSIGEKLFIASHWMYSPKPPKQ